ncbi:hypothetical protein SASPL_122307 [Salvia splendens]|uniref:K-box domain-containing protein n=1 Tax=Salvia splendens TaxID=180675 RepID=A0A8X8ZSV8_SALSN|nr:hypothetical protein SASPL_122307 [Salvia splendens]
MMQIIQRHDHQTECKLLRQPPLYIQGSDGHGKLSSHLMELSIELKQLEGEHLQGLSLASLMKLEKLIEGGMSRIRKTKPTYLYRAISSTYFDWWQNERLEDEMRELKTKASASTYPNFLPNKYAQKSIKRNAFDLGIQLISDSNCSGTFLKLG